MVATADILRSLELEPTGDDRYRAGHAELGHGVVFGGQLIAQAIVAASAGHDGKRVKTVHTVFARAASFAEPLEIVVERVQAGRAFASSTVTTVQDGKPRSRSQVLLTAEEPDFIRHEAPAPDTPSPRSEGVEDEPDSWQVVIAGGVDVSDPEAVGPPELDVWTRFGGAPDDPLLAQALLAFGSESYLIGTAMRPHQGVGQAQAHVTLSTGVITHTLTFHEPAPVDDWLLLHHRSPYAGHGRSYGYADVFTAGGGLVASFVQDAMIRPMAEAPGAGRL